ncbi:MAG: ZIP family metal transporter [Oscillospiraceae bacterium]|nr:ZIP family metal transporter [Oscillospiraceae bacterium]
MNEIIREIFIPLLGTVLGAACVFFIKEKMPKLLERALIGFAAGVMVAASVWSLIIPSFEYSEGMGVWSFVPAVVGFWLGILFLLVLDKVIPHLHRNADEAEGVKSSLKKSSMMMLAVGLHNLPEGMAVGAVIAGAIHGENVVSSAGALALAIGIAIQNFPEGAIISMPLKNEGVGKGKAFLYGVASGIVEPLGAILTILAAGFVLPLMPYLLSFAAGAMMYVVVEELVPDMSEGEHSNIGTVMFGIGFSVMMILDVVLG